MSRRRRVLFFAEAVTLAHVARPAALAASLDPERFDVTIASSQSHRHFCPPGVAHQNLHSIPSRQFVRALASGRPLYSLDDLRHYVRDDLAAMAAFKPDVVVGDFRLSLAVSARKAKVPFIGISNAYWSPHVVDAQMPLPQLPMTGWLPLSWAERLFRAALPLSMAWHLRPHAQLRRENGLPDLEHGLRQVYTEADEVLHPDIDALFPMRNAPAHHHLIGAIEWSVATPLPAWWHHLPDHLPMVYVTMGSSGDISALARILEALADLPLSVVAATAGQGAPAWIPANARVAQFLPGGDAARRSRLVICNGGSMTCQQALACGVPVLGIASNMDQFMNMRAIERAGAGLMLRADRLSGKALTDAVNRLLSTDEPRQRAQALASRMATQNATVEFNASLSRMLT